MRIRKYRGQSVEGLMRRIKRDLGSEVELLDTTSVRGRGILGLFRPREIQMTVAFEEGTNGTPGASRPEARPREREPMLRSEEEQTVPGKATAQAAGVADLLVERGVPPDAASVLARRLGRGEGAAAEVAWLRAVPIAPPREKGDQRIVALVGPTGTGKTTTCAKLAARMSLGRGLRVGLMTLDTYRIGAVEQLRKYARIMKMSLEVVFGPEEMRGALRRLGHCEVILIDTAGHSPRDRGHMTRLEELLRTANPHEIHLVMSAGTDAADARSIIRSYRPTGYNRLLLTKVDETRWPGRVISFARDAGVPLSYVCTGQEVPDDLGPASETLTRILLEGTAADDT